jgi:hypothetical protein
MISLCRCARCARVVQKDTGSLWRKLVFFSLFLSTLPYGWLLFVAGPGVAGVLPIVIALGMSIDAACRDWAFPRPRCRHCRASLVDQPDIVRRSVSPALARSDRLSAESES